MLYADLVKQKAKDVAEAKQIQTKMREVISVILDATVKEPRQPGDDTELFSYLTSMTAKKIRMQEKLFREPEEPVGEESGGIGSPPGKEAD